MRLLVVSNRLPLTASSRDGRFRFQQSAGGLVSGLSSYLESMRGMPLADQVHLWVGWPGVAVEEPQRKALRDVLLAEHRACPVFLSEATMDSFYHGFCNKTIWPLFHYFTSYAAFDEGYWKCYRQVNETFRDAVLEVLHPDDIVWIHDYHLMLLPLLLREKAPHVPIGFFLHIPFPSFEIFRTLPLAWRSEILQGLLGADLIGFHTHDYTQYFLRCVLRILGRENELGRMILDGRVVKADTFPMGIDFARFHGASSRPDVQAETGRLRETLGDSRAILSIDRLDYSKGIANRLEAYEKFLADHPEWHRKVVLLLIVVPSRIGVEHYQRLKGQIDELVGRIDGRFGSVGWTPVSYQYGFLPFPQLVSIYAVSDVALITPLRDGMNLVAKEYVAARQDGTGVLVLSEMAGASRELGEALLVNPNIREEIVGALAAALAMPPEEQVRRNRKMQIRLRRYDVTRWAGHFLQALLAMKAEQKRLHARLIGSVTKERLRGDFSAARRRILFLDYEGTLVPLDRAPLLAGPLEDLLRLLGRIAGLPATEIVLISGYDWNTMDGWFGRLPVSLVAERGAWIREAGAAWRLAKPLSNRWKPEIAPILEVYADRLPGSFTEEKEYSLVWHFSNADPEMARVHSQELVDELLSFTSNLGLHVLQGSKVVEVKNTGIDKGTAALHFLSRGPFDFILAAGDDWTDEELFKALPSSAFSIKVGWVSSNARYNLRGCLDVRNLLEEIAAPFSCCTREDRRDEPS